MAIPQISLVSSECLSEQKIEELDFALKVATDLDDLVGET